MITEIVTFEIDKNMERARVLELFEESAKIWRAHPKLLRKNYLYDPAAGVNRACTDGSCVSASGQSRLKSRVP